MVNIVEKVADSVSSLGVKRSYGDPVTIDGVELVPVSIVWFGFGAGSDDSGESGDGAGGGGGGGASLPIGAYVAGPDGPRFEPNLVALLVALVPLTWVAGKALSRIIRALKK